MHNNFGNPNCSNDQQLGEYYLEDCGWMNNPFEASG
jgi:hypothetical protein